MPEQKLCTIREFMPRVPGTTRNPVDRSLGKELVLYRQYTILKYKLYIHLLVIGTAITACNPGPKDSIEKADSTNKANQDTALRHNQLVVDSKSSDFLVRFSNLARTGYEMTGITMHNGITPTVKNLAADLNRELATINDSVHALALRKNIVLPSGLAADYQAEITNLKEARGVKLDQQFVQWFIKTHEAEQEKLKIAMAEAKDEDVRSFADISMLIFRKYIAAARAISF